MLTFVSTYIFYSVWVGVVFMYYHRYLTHRQVTFSLGLSYVIKTMIWCCTSNYIQFNERNWVLDHLNHHRYADTINDPNTPHTLLTPGSNRKQLPWQEVLKQTSHLEFIDSGYDKFLRKYSYGRVISLLVLLLLFSYYGIIVWLLIQSTPYVHVYLHGLAHTTHFGYRNFSLPSTVAAMNVLPIGVIMAGEEMHANHHSFPGRVNLAVRWFEFDTGYWMLRLLAVFGLVKFNSK